MVSLEEAEECRILLVVEVAKAVVIEVEMQEQVEEVAVEEDGEYFY